MEVEYVTIEREYGSGGTEIAAKLADRCKIACYGAEIMELAAKELHLSVAQAQQYEEKITSSFLYSIFAMNQLQTGNTEMLSMEGRLYVAERSAICSLAHYGRAVFVGHCASEALKDKDGVLHVFIRASEEFKNRRAVSSYGIEEKNAEAVCRRFNRKRAKYYAFNTTKKWDDMSNYDMILDSSRIGIDGCVEAIAAVLGE